MTAANGQNGQASVAARLTQHATAGYQPRRFLAVPWLNGPDRPPFTLAQIEMMLVDADINLGMAFLRGPLAASEWEVNADDPSVRDFVDGELRRIFSTALDAMDGFGEAYGHVGGECLFDVEDGLLRFTSFQEFAEGDACALMAGAEVGGVRVLNGLPDGFLDLPAPKGLWLHFGPSSRDVNGRSSLMAAYQPWLDDVIKNGLQDSIRLWFTQNSFAGAILLYPDGVTDEGTAGSPRLRANADIAWEIVTKARNGFTFAMPNVMDPQTGKPLWQWIKPEGHEVPAGLLEREEGLRKKKWRGMGIPDEIVQANDTGSGYAGRTVPQDGFLGGRETVRAKLYSQLERQLIRPMVRLNFAGARSTRFRVEFVPLRKSGQPQTPAQPTPAPVPQPPAAALFSASPIDSGRTERQTALKFTDQIIRRGGGAAEKLADQVRKELL